MDVTEIKKIDAYLKRLFDNPRLRVVPRAQREDTAEVLVGETPIGILTVDDEDDERSYNFRMEIPLTASPAEDIQTLTAHLRARLGSDKIRVTGRPKKRDSLEAYVGEEFIGVLFLDENKKGRSSVLEMAILDLDLEEGA